jgi:hypothetical protein
MSPLRAGEEAVGTDVLIPLVIVLALALFLTLTLVFMCLRRRLDKGPAIRPAKLYHQTDPASAKIILQTQQMKPGNGWLAGGGIYFATAPELTGHKAHKKGVILEATVSLGNILRLDAAGDPTMTLQKLKSKEYDSVCIARAVSSGQEYIVYDSKQVLSICMHAPAPQYDSRSLFRLL